MTRLPGDHGGELSSVWTLEQAAAIFATKRPAPPLIEQSAARKMLAGLDLWDYWPVQLRDGRTAQIAGGTLWMFLAAPLLEDPARRHDVARIRLVHESLTGWRDLGNLFPDGASPGSREWSGSAVLDPQSARVTVFFTATGRRGELVPSSEQRLFQCSASLSEGPVPSLSSWSPCRESVAGDGVKYRTAEPRAGWVPYVNGLRDPFWFRDPADGRGYLLFTAALPDHPDEYSGCIGIARAREHDESGGFELQPPLLQARALARELERPHLLWHQDRYYLFWSIGRLAFAHHEPPIPTGLYGMVAPSLRGPYRPLNGSSLVLTNPSAEPDQAYCWQVLHDLRVTSFVDYWGMQGRTLAQHPALRRSRFGGTPAPPVRILIDGERTRLLAG